MIFNLLRKFKVNIQSEEEPSDISHTNTIQDHNQHT